MNTIVLLGTAHSIQRGDNEPTAFRSALMEECEKYKIMAIAEEIDNGLDTVASVLAADRNIEYLYADPDQKERAKRGYTFCFTLFSTLFRCKGISIGWQYGGCLNAVFTR